MGKPLPTPDDGTLVLDYVPRPQFVAFHRRKQRYAVLICHRRAEKTIAAILDLIMRAINHPVGKKAPGRFAFIGPTYTLVKDVVCQYLKDYSRPFLSETPNEFELRVNFWNGSQIRLYGGDNPDSLRGLGSTWSFSTNMPIVRPCSSRRSSDPNSPIEKANAFLSGP